MADEKIFASFDTVHGTEGVHATEETSLEKLVSCVSKRTQAGRIVCDAKVSRETLEHLANKTGREIISSVAGNFYCHVPKFASPFLNPLISLMNPAAALSSCFI